ncbi:oligopeptide/dipeptide ABC transporter ATP-binding protein [Microvirga zambiensis]|uniref:oligopeptide/dipeptide ABC transporter ATP-binding protein n=1 Tax=Microvirga zambiensis TaxID=1402137 RepID=UPI003CCCD8CA
MSIVEANEVHKTFSSKSRFGGAVRTVRAVRGISLSLGPDRTLALVGESGCGKSTLAGMLLGLSAPSEGMVRIKGATTSELSRQAIANAVQPVFQDPYVSLNPRKTVEQIVRLPLVAAGRGNRTEQIERVHEMLELVGLPADFSGRMPRQLSGGQRQRVSIARSLVAEPQALICDEPTSALDVSVQAQIINLLLELRGRLRLSYLLITHNLAVVDQLADETAVMYFGRLIEVGRTRDVLDRPLHPYTLMLRQAVLEPTVGQKLTAPLDAAVMPNPMQAHRGCPFRARCSRASSICEDMEPPLVEISGRRIACHNPLH